MSKRTKVVGYIRVSTEAQADGGVSLEAQRAKLTAYALAMYLDLVAIHVDAGLSAKSLARPVSRERSRCSRKARRKGCSLPSWTA